MCVERHLDSASVLVRPFSPADAASVASLIVPIQREEFGFAITLADQPDLSDIPGFYQRDSGNFWVATHADQIVGTIALADIGNRQGALRKMFVAPAFRGREHGTAKLLLDTLLGWSGARGLKQVFLGTTDKFLAAHRFYEKNGFRQIARSELPANFLFMALDTRFYERSIVD